MTGDVQILRYVVHERVKDYLDCGWHIASVLNVYACLMLWMCDCKCVEPGE